MSLATLSVDLVAKLASLEAGLDKAGRLAERQAQQIERSFSGMKNAAAGIGTALVGAFSVAAITAFVRSTVNGIDKLNDLADATGSTVQNLSALEDIAARTGTGVDVVGDALLKLNKALADAKPGSGIEQALQAIGTSTAELKRLDPAEALRRLAVALAGYADDGNKARLVQELFGRSLRDVAPLLKDLSTAGRLNATVTAEQARQAEQFNNQLAELGKNAQDASRQLAGPLVSALNDFFARYKALTVLGGTGKGLLTLLNEPNWLDAGAGVGYYTRKLDELARQRQKLAADPRPLVQAIGVRDVDAEIAKVKRLEQFYRQVFGATAPDLGQSDPQELARRGRRVRPSLPELPAVAIPRLGSASGERDRPLPTVLDEGTVLALRALEQTDTAKIREINAALDALFARRASGIGGDAQTDAAIERLRGELEKLSPAAQQAAEQAQRLQAILAQTPQGQLAGVVADVELLNRAFEAGQVSVEQWGDAIRSVTARLPGETTAKIDEIDEFSRQASRNIQDALGNTLEAALGGNFSSIGKLWAATLQRMVAQAAAAQLNKALFGDFLTGGSNSGILGQLLQLFKPNPFRNLDTGGSFEGRAAGGPVAAHNTYLVGERGPELLRMGAQGGRVIPNAAAGGVSVPMTVNVSVDARSDQGQIAQLVAGAVARGRESLLLELRARGVV